MVTSNRHNNNNDNGYNNPFVVRSKKQGNGFRSVLPYTFKKFEILYISDFLSFHKNSSFSKTYHPNLLFVGENGETTMVY